MEWFIANLNISYILTHELNSGNLNYMIIYTYSVKSD